GGERVSEIGMNEGTGGAEGSAGEVERVDGPGAGWPTPRRLPRLAGAISLSGASTLMFLAGFAGGGGTAFELAAGVWRSIGWGRGAPLIGGPAGGAYIRPPLSRASCPCVPPEPDARWAPLIDVVDSYPAHEIAVLAASGGTLDGGSFERLDYHLPPDRLYGIARDPASPLGYRFRAAGRSGASTIDLPRSARFLIVPDT